MMAERVIIDTDPGIDDALALILALRSPELEIAAVTTVSGNVSVERATINTGLVLSFFGKGVLFVSQGASGPLNRSPLHAYHIHGEDGLGGISGLRDRAGRLRYDLPPLLLSPRDAVEEILYCIAASSEPVSIVALGPLTNVAAAIDKDRETMKRLKRIVFMGGAVAVPGNVTPVAEFNMFSDPRAAQIVLRSGIPLTMVGLDVTRRVLLTRERVAAVHGPGTDRIVRFFFDCTERLFDYMEEQEGLAGFPLHDPLAVGVAIDPEFVRTEDLPVEVETAGIYTQGMTVADRRPIRGEAKKPSNVSVCMEVESERFLALFLERIGCRES